MPTEKPSGKHRKKVIDIKTPGETKPSSTSRPIVVSNHLLTQDPMVSGGSGEQPSGPSGPPQLSTHGRKIMPLASEDKAEGGEGSDQPAPTAGELVAKLEAEHEHAEDKAEVEPKPEPKAEIEEPAEPVKDTEAAKTAGQPAAASEPDKTDSGETPAEPDKDNEAAEDEDDAGSKPEDKKTKQGDDEAAAEAKRQAELDELEQSGKYFVPINQVRKRHDMRLLLGLVIILLIIVIVDLLYDSGLLKSSGFTFHTHFFSR